MMRFVTSILVATALLAAPPVWGQSSATLPAPTLHDDSVRPFQAQEVVYGNVHVQTPSATSITIAIDDHDDTIVADQSVDYLVTFGTKDVIREPLSFRGAAKVRFFDGGLVVSPLNTPVVYAFSVDRPQFRDHLQTLLPADVAAGSRIFDAGARMHARTAPAGATMETVDGLDHIFHQDPGGGGSGGDCAAGCSITCQGGSSCSATCSTVECAECDCSGSSNASCSCSPAS